MCVCVCDVCIIRITKIGHAALVDVFLLREITHTFRPGSVLQVEHAAYTYVRSHEAMFDRDVDHVSLRSLTARWYRSWSLRETGAILKCSGFSAIDGISVHHAHALDVFAISQGRLASHQQRDGHRFAKLAVHLCVMEATTGTRC